MEILLATGITHHELLDTIKRLATTETTGIAFIVSPNPISLEVFDTKTGSKATGVDALSYLVKLYNANRLKHVEGGIR